MGSNSIIEAQIELEEQRDIELIRVLKILRSKITTPAILAFMEIKAQEKIYGYQDN